MERKKSIIGNPTRSTSSTTSTIKGLQLFIADLRSCQQTQEQEKRIQTELVKIKQHFNSSSTKNTSHSHGSHHDKLGGYQRKKYIAKLAYVYITSNTTKLNDILFGLDQTVQLLSSTAFSEKFIGYMTLELLYEHRQVVEKVNEKVTYYLLQDLSESDDNFVALALHFVGTVALLPFNQFATNDEIISAIFQILRSPTSSHYLKKKSALSFLTLLKANPVILTDDMQRKQLWIQRIVSLLDDTSNYRLCLAALPLVEYIAKNIDSTYCIRLVPQLTEILYNCVVVGTSSSSSVANQFPMEYKFANIPNPWLITKTVSLLSFLIISQNETTNKQLQSHSGPNTLLYASNLNPEVLSKLRQCVTVAIELGMRTCNDPMEKIVQNTVLFSLINFASKLDPTDDAIKSSVNALCSLLSSPDINTRYLTLDSLLKLCSLSGEVAINSVRYNKNLGLIFNILKHERDSSIVRKCIDLLYTFTDSENVKLIVEELLNFVLHSRNLNDPHMKSDIAVKIAVLTEKYAMDSNWFVIISLKILSLTNNNAPFNDDGIWQRLCQIVVNNSHLHKLTCDQLVDYLYKNECSESIIKTSAFLLGEYCGKVQDKISIANLFNLFTDKYSMVSNVTKAMILTTMIKLYNFAPEIGSWVIKFFQLELNSLDIELQTRSYEYLKIIQISKMSESNGNANNNNNLINVLFSPMPPFITKSNPLLKRLGGNLQPSSSPSSSSHKASAGSTTLVESTTPMTTPGVTQRPPPPPASRTNSMVPKSQEEYYVEQTSTLSPNWREGFNRMISHKQGILFTSPLIKIIYRITAVKTEERIDYSRLRVELSYINETEWDITGLSSEIFPFKVQDNPEYIIQNVALPTPTKISMGHGERSRQSFEIVIRKPFDVDNCGPLLMVHFKCGGNGFNHVKLKLGVGITHTLIGNQDTGSMRHVIELPEFIQRWKMLSTALGKDGEFIFDSVPFKKDATVDMEEARMTIRQILKRLGFDIVEQNSVKNTIFVSGIIHTKSDGNFGCLMKVKYQDDGKINLTCKTTLGGPLAEYIVRCTKSAISR
ncbi:Apl3p NDAI_0A05350 [Naumovozyma dairenensis CBS 421]|uniref:AP-2 complex subunit alpha n=1 Tax=Naumovozyma dairenensis (strain ATCC 10597 / BCRC 20456 / CBS 421 / NBRC 0211 / NRRL Y-12639) TaxID=1071378 RepID=G0W4F2_NAUDC|nr:hypothetical protein NDAI_0A05350 [Naumovozyma dairenensis CBS 421]CCD22690.1 hypothetical protein NDAI_0A05350 [Naumovozyma dairenensis CBS 421]